MDAPAISAASLRQTLASDRPPLVIDVREGWELDISRLEFARHLPMGEVTARLGELDPQAPLVVMCRSGGRSMQVCWFLEKRGFRSVSNLAGGILAWGERIDPSLRPY